MVESNIVDQAQEHTNTYLPRIDSHRPHALNETHLDAYTTAEVSLDGLISKYRDIFSFVKGLNEKFQYTIYLHIYIPFILPSLYIMFFFVVQISSCR